MTDLTDRMRTCAAHIDHLMSHNRTAELITVQPELVIDAAALLREAADALDKPQPLGEPMAILEPLPPKPFPHTNAMAQAASEHSGIIDPGPPSQTPSRMHRSCPKCGSRAAKTVHIQANTLECPACKYQWPFVLEGKWV